MDWRESIRKRIKAGRARQALWVRAIDVVRLLPSGEGRALLWTRLVHGGEVHQTTPFTTEERYPDLFDLSATLAPGAARILSFGCSTGEELEAIRRRFPRAEIVGAEINPRSRRIAARRVNGDAGTTVVSPKEIQGSFNLIFALAVLQRKPHSIEELGLDDISGHYPFALFDATVTEFSSRLRKRGLLCVINAQYRVEDSSVAKLLQPIAASPAMTAPLFGPDGKRMCQAIAKTFFRKRS